MKKLSALFLMIVFIGFSGCSSLSGSNAISMLTGNNWVLSSLMGGELDMSKFTSGLPTLNFGEGGNLTGYTGCNNFNGDFEFEGGLINLNPGATTKKACPNGGGETEFLSALGEVANFRITKDKLTLLQGAQEIMTFLPQD
ncbi:META domain-containing protein [Pararhodonellum marinum]|uniref:META domain-containing protein n=1 Tax=Pararhodonellum marinum TaxID=2755358 RepID=UPI001890284F|nr:META domain-containing protein [Pararhodonellum marinum]